ncbi:hypothetical protein ACFTTN_29125 [Streptomyces niveus]|uniref:hypothetical protein n=1 Tax=Streptomyces niveus TaxID=193462 RepID=UPI003626EF4C
MRIDSALKLLAVTATAALLLGSCTTTSDDSDPDAKPSPRTEDEGGTYTPPDSPFTRENTVVTASCEMGARYAAVAVRAWRPGEWKFLAEKYFVIPSHAAFSSYPDTAVHSALVDLCGQGANNPSPYDVDDAEFMAPRVRALFDQGFTRMAVVLRKEGTNAAQATSVTSDDSQDEVDSRPVAANRDEQNAAMSPDGRSVWFTYTNSSGQKRIGSRAVEGNQRVSDEGPSSGHDSPLSVTGRPPLAVQAPMIRLSPNGRRLAATAPNVFGTTFDIPGSSSALTRKTARNAALISGCPGVVGWVSDVRVLCRTPSGSFQVRDARSGQPVGDPIDVVGPYDGEFAQGMLVSPDGGEFIVSVEIVGGVPDESWGPEADFRVVSTTPGGKPVPVSHSHLSFGTVFIEWL